MDAKNLSKNLKRLSEISEWFTKQEDVDIDGGLKMAQEASMLIKESREQLKDVENSFEEIKKDMEENAK